MAAPPVPAQRKVKLLTLLKTTQSEQCTKLQAKHQLETDLLEDIRSYAKARAAAEKEYAQALQKITAQMLNKFQNSKDEVKEYDIKTPYGLWKKILEETDTMASARLKVSQTLMTDVAESIKTLKVERSATLKKCSLLHDKLHEELHSSANDMVKAQKTYTELEKMTIQTKHAVNEIEERLKKGTIGLFKSKAKLEKNLTKANEKCDVAASRSTKSRNDYLLYIAAVNAHQLKYYELDLPDLIAVQDSSIYDNFKTYYGIITTAEKEVCKQGLVNLEMLNSEIQELQRAYAIQYFLKDNPVFTTCTPYEMVPVPGDMVSTLSQEFEAGLQLNKDARKFCTRLAQRQKQICKKTKELTKLKAMESTDANLNVAVEPAPNEKEGKAGPVKTKEEQVEMLTEEIRHLEVLKTKCEGKIEALKQAGINTDEWLQDALNEHGNDEDEGKEDGQGEEADYDGEDDFFDEWDEPSQVYNTTNYSDDALSTTSSDVQRIGMSAMVMYPFEATAQEELSVTEGEEIEFLETLCDGWCKARNKSGQVGFVPETYIEIRSKSGTLDLEVATTMSRSSSITGSIASDALPNDNISECQTPTSIQSAPFAISEDTIVETKEEYICYAKAIYDYEACEDEELTFNEGDVIAVTSREVDDDDGWWEGFLNGKKGVFPSIVVEEMKP